MLCNPSNATLLSLFVHCRSWVCTKLLKLLSKCVFVTSLGESDLGKVEGVGNRLGWKCTLTVFANDYSSDGYVAAASVQIMRRNL